MCIRKKCHTFWYNNIKIYTPNNYFGLSIILKMFCSHKNSASVKNAAIEISIFCWGYKKKAKIPKSTAY